MDDQRRSRPDEKTTPDAAEGVRIIGADEAAEAIERGDVAARRADDELRYGDRPPAPPAGPRPALRFPLDASADPTRIERPPVQPAPDPVTGPVELPHWTDPPTGEVPAVLIGDDGPLLGGDEDELDAWSSFATSTPRWRDADDDWGDDDFVERLASDSGEVRVGALGDLDAEPSHDEYFGFDDMEQRVEERTGDTTPATVAIDGDADEGPRWELPDDDWSASAQGEVAEVPDDAWADDDWRDDDDADDGEPIPASSPGWAYEDEAASGAMGRNMGQAIPVAVGLLVLALVLLVAPPMLAALVVTVALVACAVEYFGQLQKVGWESATLLGTVLIGALPLAVYWRGPIAFGLIGAVAVIATLAWYLVGASGPDPRVLEGSGATLLGIAWIGGLGSAATAMARVPEGRWLLITAVLATAAYDIGGLFIGRSFGRTPLSPASPNKTREGTFGGMACGFVVAFVIVGIVQKGPWTGLGAAVLIGLGAALAAPLGDLCQSLIKRDLGIKDMGTLIPGHGGALDRFDGMLFVLPTVFWLAFAFSANARL